MILAILLMISLSTTTKATNISERNAKTFLNIPTLYNTPHATHPSLVSFNKRWHGFKYCLAFTPYERADYNQENPNIVASNDSVYWVIFKIL